MEKAFQRLFTRLVTLGEGQEVTRRVAGRQELGDNAWSLAHAWPARTSARRANAPVVSRGTAEVVQGADPPLAHACGLDGVVTPLRTCGSAGDSVAKGMKKISYRGYRFPPEIIHQAIWLYLRFTLSLRDVEDFWRNGASGLLRDRSALGKSFWADDRGGPAQTPAQATHDLAFG